MAVDSMDHTGGAKELFHLIASKPALLITALVGLAVVVYLLIRNGPQGSKTAQPSYSTGNTASSQPDYSAYQQGYDIGYQRASYTIPPSTNPIPDTTTTTTTVTTPVPTTTVPQNNPTNPIPDNTSSVPPPTIPPPITQTPPPPVQTPPPARTYTIVSGDTLSGIAARLGTSWQNLYAMNKQTIDTTSAQHGNPIPGGAQNNIFPGEVINY